MKIFFTALTLIASAAQAAPAKHFYECGGLFGADENRVGINTRTQQAGYFDNDDTSILNYETTRYLKSNPPQVQLIFSGKQIGSNTTLTLYFNLTTKSATLNLSNKRGKITGSSTAQCINAEPWDL